MELPSSAILEKEPEFARDQCMTSQRAEFLLQNPCYVQKAAVSKSGDKWILIAHKNGMTGSPNFGGYYEISILDNESKKTKVIHTIKNGQEKVLPHISNPVWSPDGKKVAWSCVPERSIVRDAKTGALDANDERAYDEWVKNRGSLLTVYDLETDELTHVPFTIEALELTWGTDSNLYGCGYARNRGERGEGSPEEVWMIDCRNHSCEAERIFYSTYRVSHCSLVGGADSNGAVYILETIDPQYLISQKATEYGPGADYSNWKLHKVTTDNGKVIISKIVDWELENQESIIFYKPTYVSADGNWLIGNVLLSCGKWSKMGLFSLPAQQLVLIEDEEEIMPVGWSSDGNWMFALVPDTLHPRPYGGLNRCPARYAIQSLLP
jgi:hypothetical protein